MDVKDAIDYLQSLGISTAEVLREVSRKHIFTHIQWNMKGIYLEISNRSELFQWFTPEQINTQAALPTAFRLFWEETDHV